MTHKSFKGTLGKPQTLIHWEYRFHWANVNKVVCQKFLCNLLGTG